MKNLMEKKSLGLLIRRCIQLKFLRHTIKETRVIEADWWWNVHGHILVSSLCILHDANLVSKRYLYIYIYIYISTCTLPYIFSMFFRCGPTTCWKFTKQTNYAEKWVEWYNMTVSGFTSELFYSLTTSRKPLNVLFNVLLLQLSLT